MARFSDLDFVNDAARIYFPNGYAASVVRGGRAMGGPHGLYEVAVLKGTGSANARICHTSPLDAVTGYLSADEVSWQLELIERLEGAAK